MAAHEAHLLGAEGRQAHALAAAADGQGAGRLQEDADAGRVVVGARPGLHRIEVGAHQPLTATIGRAGDDVAGRGFPQARPYRKTHCDRPLGQQVEEPLAVLLGDATAGMALSSPSSPRKEPSSLL